MSYEVIALAFDVNRGSYVVLDICINTDWYLYVSAR